MTLYALALLTASYALNFMDRYALAAMADAIKGDLGLTDTQLGLLIGLAFSLVYAVCGIPLGILADRVGRKRVLAASMAVWSLMTVLSARAGSFATLALCRAGVGIGEAGGVPPAHAMLSDLFPRRSLAMAMSVYSSGSAIGVALGISLGAALSDAYGWRNALLIMGVPGFLLALVVWLTLPDPARAPRSEARASSWSALRSVGAHAGLRSLSAAMGLAALAGFAAFAWLPTLLHRRFLTQAEGLDQVLGHAIGAANLAGILLGGVLAAALARHGRRPIRVIGTVGPLVAALSIWTACVAPSPSILILASAAGVFAHSLLLAPVMAQVQQFATADGRALASAAVLLVINILGLGAGPLVVGLLSDALTQFGPSAALSAGLIATTGAYIPAAILFAISRVLQELPSHAPH